MTVDEFMEKHLRSGVNRYGSLYFNQSTALKILADAESVGLQIVMIDAFFLTETTTQPSMADSIDFETYGVPDGTDRHDFARRLIGDQTRSDMFFELTLWPLDEEEPRSFGLSDL